MKMRTASQLAGAILGIESVASAVRDFGWSLSVSANVGKFIAVVGEADRSTDYLYTDPSNHVHDFFAVLGCNRASFE